MILATIAATSLIFVSKAGQTYLAGADGACRLYSVNRQLRWGDIQSPARSNDLSIFQVSDGKRLVNAGYFKYDKKGRIITTTVKALPPNARKVLSISNNKKSAFQLIDERLLVISDNEKDILDLGAKGEIYGEFDSTGNHICVIILERAGPHSYTSDVWLFARQKRSWSKLRIDLDIGAPEIYRISEGWLLKTDRQTFSLNIDGKVKLRASATGPILSPTKNGLFAQFEGPRRIYVDGKVTNYYAQNAIGSIHWWNRGVLWIDPDDGLWRLNESRQATCAEAGAWPRVFYPRPEPDAGHRQPAD